VSRFLALLVIALLIYFALGSLARAARRSLVGRQLETLLGSLRQPVARDREQASVELVRCRSCGIHVPRVNARSAAAGHLCERCASEAHRA
jgi:hypothetical protein